MEIDKKIRSDSQDNYANQGMIYDKFLIPIQFKIERLITFPFGFGVIAIF